MRLKKLITTSCLSVVFFSIGFTQQVLVPDSSYFVLQLDFKRILDKIPLEDMNQFAAVKGMLDKAFETTDPIEDIAQLGLDLSGKFYSFYGGSHKYNFEGISVGLANADRFLQQKFLSKEERKTLLSEGLVIDGTRVTYLKDNTYLFANISVNEDYLSYLADSIFDANEWERPYYWWPEFEITEEVEPWPEMEGYDWEEEDAPLEQEPTELNPQQHYSSVMDSLRSTMGTIVVNDFMDELLAGQTKMRNELFQSAVSRPAEAFIFLKPEDLSRSQGMLYLRNNPFYIFLDEINKRTAQTIFFTVTEEGILTNWETHGDENVMKVVQAGAKKKFDKKLLKYIPSHQQGFMVYSFNTKSAYQEVKSIYMPRLDASTDPEKLMISAVWSLLDEVLDVDQALELIGMDFFMSYQGFQSMMVDRITYDYDEETFAYTEVREQHEENIPVLTFGLSSGSSFVLEKFFKAMTKMEYVGLEKEGAYYKLNNGPIPGVPFYAAIINDIIIFTNDEDLVRHHINGYGKNALKGPLLKSALKSRIAYGHFDWQQLPQDLLALTSSKSDRQLMEALHERSGVFEVKLDKLQKNHYSTIMTYKFHGKHKNGLYYFMDLINSTMNNIDTTNY